ncbi:MAG TPA: hypothetical protein PLL10_01615 [Elusimicrobiales bacterium]|nr:hypothetical protein [Elusimicrobiales bacterium]
MKTIIPLAILLCFTGTTLAVAKESARLPETAIDKPVSPNLAAANTSNQDHLRTAFNSLGEVPKVDVLKDITFGVALAIGSEKPYPAILYRASSAKPATASQETVLLESITPNTPMRDSSPIDIAVAAYTLQMDATTEGIKTYTNNKELVTEIVVSPSVKYVCKFRQIGDKSIISLISVITNDIPKDVAIAVYSIANAISISELFPPNATAEASATDKVNGIWSDGLTLDDIYHIFVPETNKPTPPNPAPKIYLP